MSRRFEIFFDGTWQEKDQENESNVAKLFSSVQPGPGDEVLYLPGVGTGVLHFTGGLFGIGLSSQILHAYSWLRDQRPTRGDRITLTGFSRGSYAARSFSGLLYHCGIRAGDVDDIYRMYRERAKDAKTAAAAGITPRIAHLLVFDTVGALGVPSPLGFPLTDCQFHDTSLSPLVQNATHLVALQETRRHYVPTLFTDANEPDGNVEELWCPGSHSDVGGGGENEYLSLYSLHYAVRRMAMFGTPFREGTAAKIVRMIDGTAKKDRRRNRLSSSWLWPEKTRVPPPGAIHAPWTNQELLSLPG